MPRTNATILEARAEVGRPTLFSMLIIIAAHIPIFTLQRHEGRIFAPMAYTVTSALVGSLLFSLTLVPLLCLSAAAKTFRTKKKPSRARSASASIGRCSMGAGAPVGRRRCRGRARRQLRGGAQARHRIPAGAERGLIWINVTLPPGYFGHRSSWQLRACGRDLRAVPEVETVISKAGRPEDGTDPKLDQHGRDPGRPEARVRMARRVTKQSIIDEIDQALDEIPGIERASRSRSATTCSRASRRSTARSSSRCSATICDVLRAGRTRSCTQLRTCRGVARAFIDRAGRVPQSIIEIDRAQAARYGLNVADVQDVIETALGGKAATQLWEGEKQVRRRGAACARTSAARPRSEMSWSTRRAASHSARPGRDLQDERAAA